MDFPKSGTGKAELARSANEDEAIFFPEWSLALAELDWPADAKSRRKFAIMCFLKFCKGVRSPASVTLIKGYLDDLRKQGKLVSEATVALRWWVMEARRRAKVTGVATTGPAVASPAAGPEGASVPGSRERTSDRAMPSVGATDLGGPEWERALITAVRMAHFQWRTEQTYRQWGWRFAGFIQPKVPQGAVADDVKRFLEYLAVELRVGPSTQKQALNAVVFLLREALRIEVGDFSDFQRAMPGRRVPTVLTKEEVIRVFAAMDGTTRLMAA